MHSDAQASTEVGIDEDSGPAADSSSGGQDGLGSPSVTLGAFEVATTDGRLPLYLAHLYGTSLKGGEPEQVFDIDLVTDIEVHNPSDITVSALVTVELVGFSAEGSTFVEIPAHGSQTIAGLSPVLDLPKLYAYTSTFPSEVVVRVFVDDSLVAQAAEPVNISPVNRVNFFEFNEETGERADIRFLSVTLITPDESSGSVHKIITEAAQYMDSKAMTGYQSGEPTETVGQLCALYLAMQARGIVYTSVPGSFFDEAQYVKLPQQVIESGSANCVDGTFLFASALESLGMNVWVVFIPGHVFVGVKATSSDESQTIFLETTVLQSMNCAGAMSVAQDTVLDFIESEDDSIIAFNLPALRKLGVTPVPL